MEFAAAALTAVGSAVSSAVSAGASALGIGGTAAGAAGAAGGAAAGTTGTLGSLLSAGSGFGQLSLGLPSLGGGSGLLSFLSGGSSLLSVMGQLQQGDDQSGIQLARANDADTDAKIEQIRGSERRDSLRRSLLERFGEQDVAAAASGVDLSFGTPALARQESARDGERALVMDHSSEDIRVSRLNERANEFRYAAKASRRAATSRAIGTGISGLTSFLKRG